MNRPEATTLVSDFTCRCGAVLLRGSEVFATPHPVGHPNHGLGGTLACAACAFGKSKLRLVVVESPYAGEVERNVAYARAAMLDCLRRGEAPIASHLLYTQPGVLDDLIPEDRVLGIAAGLTWAERADASVFYVDFGWSRGMDAAREKLVRAGKAYETRMLPGDAAHRIALAHERRTSGQTTAP